MIEPIIYNGIITLIELIRQPTKTIILQAIFNNKTKRICLNEWLVSCSLKSTK